MINLIVSLVFKLREKKYLTLIARLLFCINSSRLLVKMLVFFFFAEKNRAVPRIRRRRRPPPAPRRRLSCPIHRLFPSPARGVGQDVVNKLSFASGRR